jgi:hypothetical protein
MDPCGTLCLTLRQSEELQWKESLFVKSLISVIKMGLN